MLRLKTTCRSAAIMLAGLSTAFSQTWTNAPTSPGGFMIACSADGTKLLVGDGDSVYTSTNSGATWSLQESLANVQVVAVSANGGAFYVSDSGNLSISTNAGLSWTHLTNRPSYSGISACQFIVCSADGSKLMIAIANGQAGGLASPLFTSTDFGNTWSSNAAPITNWECAACSADGSKWFAATYGGSVYAATNPPSPWHSVLATNRIWMSIASSADGTRLLAGSSSSAGTGGMMSSTDSGAHWRTNSASQLTSWVSVASSADGSRLMAVASGGSVISSTNYGTNWSTNNAPLLHWDTVCMTADGAKAFAAPNPEYGATATYRAIATPPSPTVAASFLGGNFLLSWPVPSTNFALQTCPDLTLTNWQGLTNVPTLNCTNLHNEVIVRPTNSAGFFRLSTQ